MNNNSQIEFEKNTFDFKRFNTINNAKKIGNHRNGGKSRGEEGTRKISFSNSLSD